MYIGTSTHIRGKQNDYQQLSNYLTEIDYAKFTVKRIENINKFDYLDGLFVYEIECENCTALGTDLFSIVGKVDNYNRILDFIKDDYPEASGRW